MKIYIILIIIFSLSANHLFSQDIKIKLDRDKSIIEFKSKSITLTYPCIAVSISPDSLKAAILNVSDKELVEVIIYNSEGELENRFKVKPLDKLVVSNDGRVAVYGTNIYSEKHLVSRSSLVCYSNNGEISHEEIETYCLYNEISFSENNKLVFLGNIPTVDNNRIIKLKVFDNDFSLIYDNQINGWPTNTHLPEIQNINSDKLILKRGRWNKHSVQYETAIIYINSTPKNNISWEK